MPEVNKILAAICFSEYCGNTFNYATRLALQLNADLVVANVINQRAVKGISTIQAMGYDVSVDDYVRGVKEEGTAQLEQMIDGSGFPKERIKSIFRVGSVFDELLKIVKEEQIDLVVMGSKGQSDHPYLLAGSVAEKMFRHSPVSVVFYKKK
jgi:nucleotide-binding universal stress UspA family protein